METIAAGNGMLVAYSLGAVFFLLAAAATFHIFKWMIMFLIHSFAVILKFIIIGFLIGVFTMWYISSHKNSTEPPANENAKYGVTQSERSDV